MSKYTYILDAGHGIDTKGKRSPKWKDMKQLLEYQYNRNIVKYLTFMLRQINADYITLVPELVDISLQDRCARANIIAKEKKCILISIHGNAWKSEKVNGFETHYYSQLTFAKTFQKYLGIIGNDRGVKKSNFYILKHTTMPAILTENGFYTNKKECENMLMPQFQYEIAYQHILAINEIERNN